METIRSFIAIELPNEVKQALGRIQGKLKNAGGAPVRWVDPGIIHLTLKFLGDIDAADTGKITAAMETAARAVSQFNIEVSGLGVFPNLQRVQIVWVGLSGELERLNQLQKRVETALTPLGFKPEGRNFTPHLTLGRVRDNARPDERQSLGRLVSGTDFKEKYVISVKSINLMKSQLTREGPIYTKIGSAALR
jgi:2'-5' RNA ligase